MKTRFLTSQTRKLYLVLAEKKINEQFFAITTNSAVFIEIYLTDKKFLQKFIQIGNNLHISMKTILRANYEDIQ